MTHRVSHHATHHHRAHGSTSGRLVQGASGSAVSELQQLLISAGIPLTGGADGRFGPMTNSAVRAFQRAHGLKVDGWAGPQTMAALHAAHAGTSGVSTFVGAAAPTGAVTASNSTGVQAALDYGNSVIGAPYAAVNPFRFGDVPWDGGRHRSVNGSSTTWQYPKGTQVFDCSGFVVACYRRAGVNLAAHGLASSGTIAANSSGFLQNLSRDQLQPGDLITYSASNGVGHVVIFLGDGKCLESSGGSGVHVGNVNWDRASAFRRVPV